MTCYKQLQKHYERNEDLKIPGSCVVCGEPTPSANVEYCENCFLLELKKWHPETEFLKADGTRTEVPEECSCIRGLGLKRRKP